MHARNLVLCLGSNGGRSDWKYSNIVFAICARCAESIDFALALGFGVATFSFSPTRAFLAFAVAEQAVRWPKVTRFYSLFTRMARMIRANSSTMVLRKQGGFFGRDAGLLRRGGGFLRRVGFSSKTNWSGPLLKKGGWLLKRVGRVLTKPVEVPKEFDTPTILSASPWERCNVLIINPLTIISNLMFFCLLCSKRPFKQAQTWLLKVIYHLPRLLLDF